MNILMSYKSPHGDVLDFANNPDFIIQDITGLTLAEVELSLASVATMDGDIINNRRIMARQMVFDLYVLPGRDVETVKREILKAIKPKETGTIYYTHSGRDLFITATVERIEMARFTDSAIMQITFHCAGAVWLDAILSSQRIGLVAGMHHFPLAIDNSATPPVIVFGYFDQLKTQQIINDGDAAVGMVITIGNTGNTNAVNPKIESADGKYFKLNLTVEPNDAVIIDTRRGSKSVYYNGVSDIAAVAAGSTWLQLELGENTFTVSDDNDAPGLYMDFAYRRAFV